MIPLIVVEIKFDLITNKNGDDLIHRHLSLSVSRIITAELTNLTVALILLP
jgi:hypothetical protein